MTRWKSALMVTVALALAACPAAASNWCGENGLVRLSFSADDPSQAVLHAEPDENGVTRVSVTAWLADVEPVALAGEAFLFLGGFELSLVVEGAEAFVTSKDIAGKGINLAQKGRDCLVGFTEAVRLRDGACRLITWEFMLQGHPENVRFGLVPEGVLTCGTIEECAGSGTRAVYIGSDSSNMLAEVVGAGCVPAWLNPDGEPDLTPERGASGWRDVGRLEERVDRGP